MITVFSFQFLLCVVTCSFASAADKPLNVVLIFADDLSNGDLGCYGATTPITPLTGEHGTRVPNSFGGALAAHQLYNDFTVGTTLVERSTKWIREQSHMPFFLYLSTTNIHHPFTPASRFQGTSQCGLYGTLLADRHHLHPPQTQFGEGQPAIAWLGRGVRID